MSVATTEQWNMFYRRILIKDFPQNPKTPLIWQNFITGYIKDNGIQFLIIVLMNI
jgi:hypothetical protein